MKAASANFNTILESIYNLPLEYKEELKNLLEHNIADVRRNEMKDHYKIAQKEHTSGKLQFSSSTRELKKML